MSEPNQFTVNKLQSALQSEEVESFSQINYQPPSTQSQPLSPLSHLKESLNSSNDDGEIFQLLRMLNLTAGILEKTIRTNGPEPIDPSELLTHLSKKFQYLTEHIVNDIKSHFNETIYAHHITPLVKAILELQAIHNLPFSNKSSNQSPSSISVQTLVNAALDTIKENPIRLQLSNDLSPYNLGDDVSIHCSRMNAQTQLIVAISQHDIGVNISNIDRLEKLQQQATDYLFNKGIEQLNLADEDHRPLFQNSLKNVNALLIAHIKTVSSSPNPTIEQVKHDFTRSINALSAAIDNEFSPSSCINSQEQYTSSNPKKKNNINVPKTPSL